MFMISVKVVVSEDWSIVAENMRCSETNYSGWKYKTSVAQCSEECKPYSTMFAYGFETQYSSIPNCLDDECLCICELAGDDGGSCTMVQKNGWNLYKHDRVYQGI